MGQVDRFVARWVGAAERFLSAFYRALSDQHGPAVRACLSDAILNDMRLYPIDFPTRPAWNLCAVLIGHAESGMVPTVESVLVVADGLDIEIIERGGDRLAELDAVLNIEASAAGLASWGRICIECRQRSSVATCLRASYREVLDPTERLGAVLDRLARTLPTLGGERNAE